MSNTYTCLSCRLQSIARNSRHLVLRQRRSFTPSNQWRQDVQTARRGEVAGNGEVRGSRRDGEQLHFETGRHPPGRYSGRRLAPEQLLHQLEATPKAPQFRPNSRHTSSPLVNNHAASLSEKIEKPQGPSPLLEPSMLRLRGLAIWLKEGTEAKDDELWKAMKKTLRTTSDPEKPKLLMAEKAFRITLSYWVNRVLQRWLEAEFPLNLDSLLRRVDKRSNWEERLTPYKALKCKTYFQTDPGIGFPRTMWSIAKATAECQAFHSKPSQPPHIAVIEGLHELMRIWHLYMALNLCTSASHSRLRAILDAPNFDWSFLPEPTAFVENLLQSQYRKYTRVSLNDVLDMLVMSNFDRLSKQKLELNKEFDMESSAVVTLGLLQDVRSLPGGANEVKEYEPWSQLMELSLKNVGSHHLPGSLAERMIELGKQDRKRLYYQSMVKRLNLDLGQLKDGQGHIQKALEDSEGTKMPEEDLDTADPSNNISADGLAKAPAPNSGSNPRDRFAYLCIKRLSRAVQQTNIKAADRVRQDVANFMSRNQDQSGNPITQSLYEHMIYSYLRLMSIRTAVQLWEEMVQVGYVPRMKTYTTMMRGSRHLKDLSSMEYFWTKMKKANIQPDATAWSTRISGLLNQQHIEPGLKALSEMGQNWLLAAKEAYSREHGTGPKRTKGTAPVVTAAQLLARYSGDVNGVPRPDVVIMNSAINALARGPDHLIPKVLAWGRSFGIEPDQYSYNALIHVAMRHNQGEEALKIVQRMREQDIKMTSHTWTIILTDMLVGGFLDGLSPDEQQAKVFEFLSLVDAEDVDGLGAKGYALLLDRLIKDHGNHSAAQAVLTHMSSKGMQPSVHIYTILMDSHLKQSPPNFAAADSLWEHIDSAEGGYGAALDSKFFDLVIKGYAPHHQTIGIEKILSFLERTDKEGKRTSWSALEATARALAERTEWARLAQIVDRARRRVREERGTDPGTGQWSFWQFVISTGILRHEGITMPEQIMGVA